MKSFFVIFAFGIANFSTAQNLSVVKSNHPNATIIVNNPATSAVTNAAKVLQDYIQKSTGALLPISSVSENNISIHVGLTSYVKARKIDISNLDEDGFILQGTDAGNYIIVGGSDWGTEFGVYEFLERYLGVHWLMPTEIGTDIPTVSNLSIPATKVKENPVYLSRQLSPVDINIAYPLGIWGRFNRARGRISFHHNLLDLFPPDRYANTHPEFYPLVKGKRIIPTKSDFQWQPNFSAPGIADTAAARIIAFFKKNPTASSYSLGMNDSFNFDESPGSSRRRSGKKNFLGYTDVSDDYFLWVNEVVDKVLRVFPNKKFGLLAYDNIVEPPTTTSVHSNVIPFMTYERSRWADPDLQKNDKGLTERWGNQVKEIGWYDYVYGFSYLVPKVWFHTMQAYLLWGSRHKVKYYYGELYPNWGEGPKAWVLTKLLWNPNRNVDSLLNVWYEHAAGKGASPYLRQFYSIWERFWTVDIYKNSKWNIKYGQYLPFTRVNYLNDVPAEYIDTCDILMKKALDLADNPKRKELVRKLNEMWDFYKSCILTYQAKNGNPPQKEVETRLKMIEVLKKDPLFSNTMSTIISQQKKIVDESWSNLNQ